jgi:hypothetical protein
MRPMGFPPKIILASGRNPVHCARRLLDSLSLSRHGESSSELDSVMILDPMFGNSLWKSTGLSDSKTSYE